MENLVPLANEKYIDYINRVLKIRPNKKISNAQQKHHIIPKSRGGSNDADNLIWLFASEHAYAHYLYSIEHPNDSGMAYAAISLAHKNNKLLTDEEINRIAAINSVAQSNRVKGEKNPMWGRKHTEESKNKNAQSQKGKCAGEKNPMYGVHLSGELHPRFGKPVSNEQRIKQSKAMTGKMMGGKNPNSKSILCVNTGQVFDTIKEAAYWCNIKPATISKALRLGKNKAGKIPGTKEIIEWKLVK